jgi:hypothetical protein
MSRFDYFAYYSRCIDKGWGFNAAAKDVWATPVLSVEQIATLARMAADYQPGWKAPIAVEVDPYRHLRAKDESTLWDAVFE